jgi:hypothetical protein
MVESIFSLTNVFLIGANPLLQDVQTLLSSPVVALAFIFAVGALGLYMLLPVEHPYSESAVKWFGGPLMLISLFLLSALVSVRVNWWPQIPEEETVPRWAFAIPAFLGLAFAVLAITSRRTSTCLIWFAALLAMTTVILLQNGAVVVAFANSMLALCVLIFRRVWVVPQQRSKRVIDDERRQSGGEPALACFTGALLCVVLVAIITRATSGGNDADPERLERTMTTKREDMVQANLQQSGAPISRPRLLEQVRAKMVSIRQHPVALLAGGALLVTSLFGAICVISRPREAMPYDKNLT